MTGRLPSVRGIDRAMEGTHGRMWHRCTDSGSTRHRDVEVGLCKHGGELHLSCRWTSNCGNWGRTMMNELGSGMWSLGGLRKNRLSVRGADELHVNQMAPKLDTSWEWSP